MRTRYFYFILPLILIISSCSSSDKKDNRENAVARVYDNYLYRSDLQDMVAPGISGKDSLALVNEYIDNWVRQQLLLRMAEDNLPKNKMDFTRQLEDYRSSLIIFSYERELIRQKLDTTVSEQEVKDYYETHKGEFELKDNIVKVLYFKVNNNTPVTLARAYLKSDRPQDKQKLQDFCMKYAINYYLDDQSWLLFNDILKEIPINTYNQEEYLKNNRLIEIQDSTYHYLMNIKGFMIKESLSPLSFEKGNIREIILNKRKQKLIDEMRNNIYNEAVKKSNFEVFTEKK
ncbi:MAG: hypothetical protein WCM76_12175 [Bacteroidota bacterium]